jgi:hypothetical protein
MKIPPAELHRVETKCNILSLVEEDFRHVIADVERRYQTQIQVSVIRPIFGGGAGPRHIILQELEIPGSETQSSNGFSALDKSFPGLEQL